MATITRLQNVDIKQQAVILLDIPTAWAAGNLFKAAQQAYLGVAAELAPEADRQEADRLAREFAGALCRAEQAERRARSNANIRAAYKYTH